MYISNELCITTIVLMNKYKIWFFISLFDTMFYLYYILLVFHHYDQVLKIFRIFNSNLKNYAIPSKTKLRMIYEYIYWYINEIDKILVHNCVMLVQGSQFDQFRNYTF